MSSGTTVSICISSVSVTKDFCKTLGPLSLMCCGYICLQQNSPYLYMQYWSCDIVGRNPSIYATHATAQYIWTIRRSILYQWQRRGAQLQPTPLRYTSKIQRACWQGRMLQVVHTRISGWGASALDINREMQEDTEKYNDIQRDAAINKEKRDRERETHVSTKPNAVWGDRLCANSIVPTSRNMNRPICVDNFNALIIWILICRVDQRGSRRMRSHVIAWSLLATCMQITLDLFCYEYWHISMWFRWAWTEDSNRDLNSMNLLLVHEDWRKFSQVL